MHVIDPNTSQILFIRSKIPLWASHVQPVGANLSECPRRPHSQRTGDVCVRLLLRIRSSDALPSSSSGAWRPWGRASRGLAEQHHAEELGGRGRGQDEPEAAVHLCQRSAHGGYIPMGLHGGSLQGPADLCLYCGYSSQKLQLVFKLLFNY